MIDITILKKYSHTFERLFFILPGDFNLLVSRVEPMWKKNELVRRNKTNIKHKITTLGSGRLPKCSLEERIAMFLLYHHNYVSHKFLGKLFDVDESRISQYFRYLRPIILDTYSPILYKSKISEEEILDTINNIIEEHPSN